MKQIISPYESEEASSERFSVLRSSLDYLNDWDERSGIRRNNPELDHSMRQVSGYLSSGSSLPSHLSSSSSLATYLYSGSSLPTYLAALPAIMRNPKLMIEPLVHRNFPKYGRPDAARTFPDQREVSFESARPSSSIYDLRHSVTRVDTLLSWLHAAYASRGEVMPNSLEQIRFQEHGVRRVRQSLRGLFRKRGEVAVAASEVYASRWLTVIGSSHLPLSEITSTAMIRHHHDGDDALLVSRDGRIMSFFVPMSSGRCNRSVITACEMEIMNVDGGGKPKLQRSRSPLLTEGGLSPNPMDEPIIAEAAREVRNLFPRVDQHDRRVLDEHLPLALWHQLYAARDAVRSCLPKDTLSISGCFGFSDIGVLGWMTGSEGLSVHPDWRERRADVEDSFSYSGGLFHLAEHPEFRAAVSLRRPLVPVVRALTGLTRAQVDQYSRMPTPSRPEDVIRCPAPFAPETLSLLTNEQVRMGSLLHSVFRQAAPERSEAATASDAARMVMTRTKNELSDSLDALRQIEERIVQGICLDMHGERNEATESFLRSKTYPASPKALLRVSHLYHTAVHHGLAEMDEGSKLVTASWDPLTRPLITENVIVRELSSAADIIYQGGRQGHCVGSYVNRVLRGRALILSLSKPGEREPLTTAEINLDSDGARVSTQMVQHRGKFNRNSTHDEDEAVMTFLAHNDDLSIRDLQSYRANMVNVRVDAERDRAMAQLSFTAMIPMLPEDVSGSGYEALLEEAVLRHERPTDAGDDDPTPSLGW